MIALMASSAVCTPPLAASDASHPAGQDRQPAHAQQQFGRVRQPQAGHDVEHLDVDVRLIEPVEQHEAVDARIVELPREVGDRREERR